ncbi:MAG: YqaJ viral recombinase family protein, partial [Eikenella corrodens]
YGAARKNYMAELLCQRLTGQQEEKFTSAAMQHGTDTEPAARAMYMLETGADVTETGFIPHPTIAMSGASPDGLVGEDGLIEIKCPNTATHLEFLQNQKPKHEYLLQMQWQMACTGRQWCDFVSYDDRLPEKLAYRCIRIPRDDKLIAELEEEAVKFLTELDKTVRQLEEQAA